MINSYEKKKLLLDYQNNLTTILDYIKKTSRDLNTFNNSVGSAYQKNDGKITSINRLIEDLDKIDAVIKNKLLPDLNIEINTIQ